MIIKEKVREQKFHYLYWAIFIYAISDAIFAYAQSTFLNQYFNLQLVGLIFFGAYFLTFIVINRFPNLIARYSNLKTALAAIFLRIICLLVFIFSSNSYLLGAAFILFITSLVLTFINLDIFLEAFTKNATTGKVRGIYFTIYNLGWLVSPFLAGEILNYLNFQYLFLISLILNLPLALILFFKFRHAENHYASKTFNISKTLAKILTQPDLRKIFTLSFLLQFFYAVEVVYIPIYLIQNIGLNWEQIGIIFTVMLIPFVLIQYPAGYLADKYFGEKEMLFIGLVLMGVTAIIMGFINTPDLLVWSLVLFISRIGASLFEIMRETYFFKKVDVDNIDIINAVRSTIPLAYLVAPALAITITYYSQLNYLFVAMGIILLLGLWPTLTLRDTK